MYLGYMEQRTITHLALISKDAQSLKTTIPRNIVKLLKLKSTDMLEGYNCEEVVVPNPRSEKFWAIAYTAYTIYTIRNRRKA